jgi:MSHA pilin protein MshD
MISHWTAPASARGATLVELVVAIVIIGLAMTGVMMVFVRNTSSSADPLIWHQATAIAEAYLEEVLSKNFDPNGPEGPETRDVFDDVGDYGGLTDNGARDQTNTPISGLEGYIVNVTVTPTALNGIAAANSLRVAVRVTSPFGGNIVVSGFRTNY